MSFYMRSISLQVAVGVSWQAGFDKSPPLEAVATFPVSTEL